MSFFNDLSLDINIAIIYFQKVYENMKQSLKRKLKTVYTQEKIDKGVNFKRQFKEKLKASIYCNFY